MSRPNKFVIGARIKTLDELFKLLDREKWAYLDGVPKHPQWLLSMSLRSLGIAVEDKRMHAATPNAAARKRPAARKAAPRERRKVQSKSHTRRSSGRLQRLVRRVRR